MTAQTPVPKDHPLMVAWEARKATEEHANDVRWAKVEAHTVGSLWSAFEAGWRAYEAALSAAGLVVVPLQALEDATEFLDMWAGDNSDRANEPVWNAIRTLRAMIAAALPAAPQEERNDGR